MRAHLRFKIGPFVFTQSNTAKGKAPSRESDLAALTVLGLIGLMLLSCGLYGALVH